MMKKKLIYTFTGLCLLILFFTGCPKTPSLSTEKAEDKIQFIELEKYVPSVSYKTRPGLYFENNILMHEGKAYTGIGVNFFGAFCNYFVSGNKEFNEMFALLAARGIEFCRINIGLFWPVNYAKWDKNQQLYYACLDEVIRSAEQNNIGIICSFFWHIQGISDYYDEPLNAWGDLKSKTRKYCAQYTEQIVRRYMESPAIWGYEFGNEINLACDLPNAADHRGAIIPELGTRLSRDKNDELTSDIAQPLLENFAKLVKKTDKYGRIVTSGCAEPRPSQYNQKVNKSWKTDIST